MSDFSSSDFSSSDSPPKVTLAEALRSLPVPQLSPDFDDRILAALSAPVPWWQCLWQPAKPLLLGASCSLMLTLLLLHLTLSGPQAAPVFSPASLPNLAAAPSAPLPPLDALLDRPGLCAGSLAASAWNSPPAPDAGEAGEVRQEKSERRPEPRRRAEVSRRVTLIV